MLRQLHMSPEDENSVWRNQKTETRVERHFCKHNVDHCFQDEIRMHNRHTHMHKYQMIINYLFSVQQKNSFKQVSFYTSKFWPLRRTFIVFYVNVFRDCAVISKMVTSFIKFIKKKSFLQQKLKPVFGHPSPSLVTLQAVYHSSCNKHFPEYYSFSSKRPTQYNNNCYNNHLCRYKMLE